MMPIISKRDAETARKLRHAKQELELGLGKDLTKEFTRTALTYVRRISKDGMAELTQAYNALAGAEKERARAIITNAMRGYDKLRPHIPLVAANNFTATNIENAMDTWTLAECGDWIRCYTDIVEEKTVFGNQSAAELKGQRKGPSYLWKKTGLQGDKNEALKTRRRGKTADLTPAAKAFAHFNSCPVRQKLAAKTGSGTGRFTVSSTDITRKINAVFGMMTGAAISGTTVANIFFLKRLMNHEPIIALLPLANLIASGHHSLLEIAIPLTGNSAATNINYTIGMYSTLLPRAGNRGNATSNTFVEIRRLLKYHEESAANPMIFCFYKNQRLAGCFEVDMTNQGAKSLWKKAFTINDNFLDKFSLAPAFPTEHEVKTLLFKLGFLHEGIFSMNRQMEA